MTSRKSSSGDREQLLQSMEDLLEVLQARQYELYHLFINHMEYHKQNEAKWGLVKIISEHPIKMILAALTLGALLARSPVFNGLIKLLEIFK